MVVFEVNGELAQWTPKPTSKNKGAWLVGFFAIADKCYQDARQHPPYTEHSPSFNADEVQRLAELVLALDEWQLKGGFSPYDRK